VEEKEKEFATLPKAHSSTLRRSTANSKIQLWWNSVRKQGSVSETVSLEIGPTSLHMCLSKSRLSRSSYSRDLGHCLLIVETLFIWKNEGKQQAESFKPM